MVKIEIYRDVHDTPVVVNLRHILFKALKIYRRYEKSQVFQTRKIDLEIVLYLCAILVKSMQKSLYAFFLGKSRSDIC